MVPAAGEREGGRGEGGPRPSAPSVRPDQFKASLIALTSLASGDREGKVPGRWDPRIGWIMESVLELDTLGQVFKSY